MKKTYGFCSLCMLLIACADAGAQTNTLYKWKDASGVTQYSETPPQGQKYESRQIDTPHTVETQDSVEAPAVSAECSAARANLEVLARNAPVTQDTDGDGKPDTTLNDEQRAAQKTLAEAAAKAYCAP